MYWPSGRRLLAAKRVQSFYARNFERDMGCTEAEWLGWLPAALGDNAWQRDGASVQASIGAGSLQIHWQPAPPRVIGLARIPRLLVRFAFAGLDDAQRYVFMKRFDLYMQRGGG